MPRTEAGKRLEGFLASVHISGERITADDAPRIRADVAAIEAEAVAAERERITREVDALPGMAWPDEGDPALVYRDAVLAIVNPEPEP